jgi:membrane protein
VNLISVTRQTFAAFNDDKAQRLAAAIAFSTIFAIAPLLVILIAVVGGILSLDGAGGHTAAENSLIADIAKNAGASTADTVRQLIDAGFNKPHQNRLAQVVGWVAFAFTASNLFASLQDALNAIWHVEATRGGWKQMIRGRIAAFAMIVIVGALLLATFLANAAIAFVGTNIVERIPFTNSTTILTLVEQGVSLVVTAIVFALLFKVLPDVRVAWRDVWIGAGVTAVLFVFGEALISLYLAYGGIASAYGAAGSILVALIWLYYSAMILLLGAEFTKVFATRAELTVPASVRHLTERPAGADPRYIG